MHTNNQSRGSIWILGFRNNRSSFMAFVALGTPAGPLIDCRPGERHPKRVKRQPVKYHASMIQARSGVHECIYEPRICTSGPFICADRTATSHVVWQRFRSASGNALSAFDSNI